MPRQPPFDVSVKFGSAAPTPLSSSLALAFRSGTAGTERGDKKHPGWTSKQALGCIERKLEKKSH